MKFFNENKFANIILDKNIEVFVIYINSLIVKIIIYLVKYIKISSFFVEKFTIFIEYSNFDYVFLKMLVKILPKYIADNKYIIKLKKSNQTLYGFIYNL